MKGKYFLDTNILVYSFDKEEPAKRETSLHLITRALADESGLISWQVVQEFLNVSLHKWARPMSPDLAEVYLQTTLVPLCRVFPSPSLWGQALAISRQTNYHLYDSMIVAAALQSGAETLYSEDLQHGRRIDRITIINPYL